jgi:monoamine oxidase
LRDIERVHNREEHGGGEKVLEEIFVGGLSHSWADDEFTSGAFAMFEPYQFRDIFKDIWKPEGGIHFCGEHTSMKHGWIEGAIESGIRAAKEVHNVIQEKR